MTEPPDGSPRSDGLNPALRKRTDETHDTAHRTPPPADSASVQRAEGRAWPVVWAVVTIVGIIIALWVLFF